MGGCEISEQKKKKKFFSPANNDNMTAPKAKAANKRRSEVTRGPKIKTILWLAQHERNAKRNRNWMADFGVFAFDAMMNLCHSPFLHSFDLINSINKFGRNACSALSTEEWSWSEHNDPVQINRPFNGRLISRNQRAMCPNNCFIFCAIKPSSAWSFHSASQSSSSYACRTRFILLSFNDIFCLCIRIQNGYYGTMYQITVVCE